MAIVPVIETKSLVAGYLPGVNILNGANFFANQGELVGIIGPNGAGKSTLLKAIFGLVKVREGEILLNGESIANLKAHKGTSRVIIKSIINSAMRPIEKIEISLFSLQLSLRIINALHGL